jgi:glycosyltransferase involved in cell wall biosynthesis
VKILFYNHTGRVSGAERVLMMILEGLDRSRFDTVLLCPAEGRLADMGGDAKIKVVAIDHLAARFTLRPYQLVRYLASFVCTIREARAAVRSQTPDIIHANSIRAGLVMSAATMGMGVPVVWHAHDLVPRHLLSVAIRLFSLLSPRNRIIAVSDAVANRFRGKLLRVFSRRVRITTIHNAVDLERFQPDPQSRQEVRRAHGIADRQLLIGIVGQLTPRKGQRELIEAFSDVAREIPDAVLMIVGEPIFNRDDEYADSLKISAGSSGSSDRIQFTGPRDDVPALMRAFDLLVVNSRSEPFGLTVTEAMASGTPVVATAVDGIPEIIRHGESGWLIKAGDHSSLVDGMLTLLLDPDLRRKFCQSGRQAAIERFSQQRFLNETQSLYRTLRSGRKLSHTVRAERLQT